MLTLLEVSEAAKNRTEMHEMVHIKGELVREVRIKSCGCITFPVACCDDKIYKEVRILCPIAVKTWDGDIEDMPF